MARYTTIWRGSERHVIESDRLDRFLEAGWTTKKATVRKPKSKKKLLPKVEIKAQAEVINHNEPLEDDLSDIEWEINNLKEESNDGNTNR
jgi:hypothetical protein